MSLIVIILESSIGEGYDVLHFNTIIFLLLYFFNVLIANFKSSKFDNPEDKITGFFVLATFFIKGM